MSSKRPRKTPLQVVRSGVTQEEKGQLLEIVAEHPWSLTLEAFLKRVESVYGYRYKYFPAVDPTRQEVRMPYLEGPDGKRVHLPGRLEPEDQLDPFVTASLCRRLRIPLEDFGLSATDS